MDLLRQRWPEFAGELEAALSAAGQDDLASTVASLSVVGVCGCGDAFCQSFATAAPAEDSYGPGHRNIELEPPWPGYLVLDLLDDQIVYVEVLYRDTLN